MYPTTSRPAAKNRNLRIVAILLILVLAGAFIGYTLINRGTVASEVRTASGLRYTDIVEGTGPTPQRGQILSVHYTGMLENGTKFDSSYDKRQPMNFRFGDPPMIKGWDEGVSTMKVGGKRRLVVPPSLGYGAPGRPPEIPPNAVLIFEIELLSIS